MKAILFLCVFFGLSIMSCASFHGQSDEARMPAGGTGEVGSVDSVAFSMNNVQWVLKCDQGKILEPGLSKIFWGSVGDVLPPFKIYQELRLNPKYLWGPDETPGRAILATQNGTIERNNYNFIFTNKKGTKLKMIFEAQPRSAVPQPAVLYVMGRGVDESDYETPIAELRCQQYTPGMSK